MKSTTQITISTFAVLAFLLLLHIQAFAVAKSWVGYGSGGASSATDFNTAGNWSPSGVPGSGDDVTIAMTSNGSCILSANVTVNNFTFTVSGSNTGNFDVGTSIITVNGTTSMNAINYTNSANYSYLRFNVGSAGAGIVFYGTATIHTTGSGTTYVYGATTNPGSLTFYSDLTINSGGRTAALVEPKLIFDAVVSQTITVNNTDTYFLGENDIFGLVNSPTITFAGSNPTYFGCYDGGMQINNSTIVKAMNTPLDRFTGGGSGTFAMASGTKLELNFSNNFPGSYPTYALNANSTVEYLGSATTQDIGNMPGIDNYGHLIIGGTGNKQQTSVGGINVQGNLTVRSGSTYYAYAETSTIQGDLLISSTGTYNSSSNTQTFKGNFQNDGTWTTGTSAVVFSGTAAQAISGATTNTTFYGMTVNNTSPTGITLTTPVAVSNALTLTDGNVFTDATNLLILNDNATSTSGSAASFVDGPMKKIGNEAFVFPVGDNTIWARVAITAPSATSDAFTARYYDAAYATLTPVTSPNAYISSTEHWILDRTTGTSNVSVTLYWENGTRSGINTFTSDLHVARWDGSAWQDHGSGTMTGNAALGTVRTSAAVSSFSPFTFASASADIAINPLPVELLSFEARLNNTQVDLTWETATEINNDFFTVEKSINGQTFEEVLKTDGAGNSFTNIRYSAVDIQPYAGTSYYRLKQTDFNGELSYSNIVPVEYNPNGEPGISLFPNPSDGSIAFLSLNQLQGQEMLVILRDIAGKELFTKIVNSSCNNEVVTVDPDERLTKGAYVITVTSTNKFFSQRLIVK